MQEKIIAFVDGSIYSQSVCEHAAWIATRTGAPVDLLHVIGRRDTAGPSDFSGSIRLGARSRLLAELAEVDAQRAKLLQERGRAILEDARRILDEAGVLEVATRLRYGDIVETVAEQEAGASMILVGKRGEAADFAKLHLGSNLERIVRASTRPVFVAARGFRPIRKLLIAFDGGRSALKAVDHVARGKLYAGLGVRLVTVGPDTPEARKALDGGAALLKGAGLAVETTIVQGQPDEALAAMIEGEGFDMLVMGAYGHSRIRTLVIGSTTAEMLRSCKVSVVLIR